MAFAFSTRMPETLFFPTVHVHDGRYHETAHFDHILFCQAKRDVHDWEKSFQPLGQVWDEHFKAKDSAALNSDASTEWDREGAMITVKRDWFGYKKLIYGNHKNEDILIHIA